MSPRREGLHGAGMVSGLRAGAVHSVPTGWWDPNNEGLCVWGAWQAKGALSLADSYVDLSGNGNNLSLGVAPGWAVGTGWQFDGVTHFLKTGFIPASDQSQSYFIQFTNGSAVTGNKVLFGMLSGVQWTWIRPVPNAIQLDYAHGTTNVFVSPNKTTGNLGIAGNQGYRDGVPDGGAIAGFSAAPTRDIWIGAMNNGAATWYYQFYGIAFVIYDCVLTAGQVASVYAAMAAL